jgi:hypothetical protein
MIMSPRLRKAVLTVHVATSVGWLGAVAAYLVLDVATAVGGDAVTVRSGYLTMEVLVRYAIVPLAVATVTVGIVNALGTPWGLFRHYWVIAKLVLTLAATIVLLKEVPTVDALADLAVSSADPRPLGNTLVHSGGGLLVLLTTLVLSIYKPRGLTSYGWRQQRQQRQARTAVGQAGQESRG